MRPARAASKLNGWLGSAELKKEYKNHETKYTIGRILDLVLDSDTDIFNDCLSFDCGVSDR